MTKEHPRQIAIMLIEERRVDLKKLSDDQLEQIENIFRLAFEKVALERQSRVTPDNITYLGDSQQHRR